ncbi:MFS transporter [Viridibacillus arvi]|uniref:MFS transporter n=1 Tax=Viridibacillus arvi TaxID=263475 RepID=UPI0036DFBFCB
MIENVPSKKPVIVIALVMAVCLLGNEMLFIVLPLYWKFFGLTALWQVGVLLSVNRFIRIVINSLIAWYYRKVNTRMGILLAVVLAVISTFSYGYLKGIWFLLIARCLWGFSWSLFRLGGYLTIITYSSEKTRGEYVGLFNGLWGLGTLIGMLFGGILAEQIGIQSVTTVFSIIGACSIPFVLMYIPKTKNKEEQMNEEKKKHQSIWKNERIVLSLASGIIIYFVIFGVFNSTLSNLIGIQIKENLLVFGLSLGAASLAGIFQAIRTGWEPFLAPLLGKWSDQKWERSKVLIFALLMASVCFFILPLKFSTTLFIFFIFVFQLSITLLVTMSDSIATDVATGQSQMTVLSLYTLSSDIGAAFGALIAFVMMDFLGISWLYWITGLLLLILAFQWMRANKKLRNQEDLLDV